MIQRIKQIIESIYKHPESDSDYDKGVHDALGMVLEIINAHLEEQGNEV